MHPCTWVNPYRCNSTDKNKKFPLLNKPPPFISAPSTFQKEKHSGTRVNLVHSALRALLTVQAIDIHQKLC